MGTEPMSKHDHEVAGPFQPSPGLERRRQISDRFAHRGVLSEPDIAYLAQLSPVNILHVLVTDPDVPLELAVRALGYFPSARMEAFLRMLMDDRRFARIRSDVESTLRAIRED